MLQFYKKTAILWPQAVYFPQLNARSCIRCCCLLSAFFFFAGPGFGQAEKQVTFGAAKEPLAKALTRLSKISGTAIGYPTTEVEKVGSVTIPEATRSLPATLDLLLKETAFGYKFQKGRVIVFKKEKVASITENLGLINVTGKVVDENGQPLPAISITVQGTDRGTATDGSGAFNLDQVPADASISAQGVGYPAQSFNVVGTMIIRLSRAVSNLDEVQVIAYGTTTKRFNTGSVSGISSKEIEIQPVSNPLATLQGRVPGITITQTNGLPGSNFTVQIRGKGSLQQGSNPLYIVNGVPFISDNLSQVGSLLANSPFNSLNPSDIESIDVLKDADATAIYGSRGANGVILITTKAAKNTTTSLEANFRSGWGNVTVLPRYMNTGQYLAMRRQAFANDNVTPTSANAYDLLNWNSTQYNNWPEILIGNTAKTANGNLRVSGGSQSTRVSLGASYYKETTVMPGTQDANRVTFDFTGVHASQDKRFNMSVNANYGVENSSLMRSSITGLLGIIPNSPYPIDEQGNLVFVKDGITIANPFAQINMPYHFQSNRLNTNGNLSYRIITNLFAKINLGYNQTFYDEKSQIPIAAQNPALNPTGTSVLANNNATSWIIEPQLQYVNTFKGKHKLDILFGSTWQKSGNEAVNIFASGYTNDDLLGLVSTIAASNINTTNTASQYKYNAFFGRINYNFQSKYIINITGRRDGSSRFGYQNRFANFGAIGGAWIFTSEKWLHENASILSFGKVRSSYGITGNDQIGDYRFLDTWQPTAYPYNNSYSLRVSQLYNGSYQWESNRKFDIALELGLLKDKVLVSVNWFRNISANQLINYRLPIQTGFGSVLRNFDAKVENTGWEIGLNATDLAGKIVHWASGINLTIPRNRLASFPGLANSTYASSYVIGQPINLRMGYTYTGIDTQTGIYTFLDRNNDGILNSLDYDVMGTIEQKLYGGWSNSFKFRGISLDFLFQFVKQTGMHPFYSNGSRIGMMLNVQEQLTDVWQNPGDDAPFQKYSQQTGGAVAVAARNMASSDAAITDASFIRLKNISLSYSLPENIIRRLHLSNVRCFAEGQNLATITGYKGADPESQIGTQIPPQRIIALGIQINH